MVESHAITSGLKVSSQRIRNKYGSMAATCAPNRYRDVGLSFLLVLRDQVVQKTFETAEELRRFGVRSHELDDGGITPGLSFQIRNEMRVR